MEFSTWALPIPLLFYSLLHPSFNAGWRTQHWPDHAQHQLAVAVPLGKHALALGMESSQLGLHRFQTYQWGSTIALHAEHQLLCSMAYQRQQYAGLYSQDFSWQSAWHYTHPSGNQVITTLAVHKQPTGSIMLIHPLQSNILVHATWHASPYWEEPMEVGLRVRSKKGLFGVDWSGTGPNFTFTYPLGNAQLTLGWPHPQHPFQTQCHYFAQP